MSETITKTENSLALFTLEQAEKSLPSVAQKEDQQSKIDPAIERQADEMIERLLSIDPKDLRAQQDHARAVQALGENVSRELARKSAMLKEPMRNLMDDAQDGSSVANSLLNLQEQVSDINPNRVDFDMGSIRRLLSMLPGIGTPLSRWFARYQSVENVLEDIINSLRDGRSQLERDNVTLSQDQIEMRELTFKLHDYIAYGHIMDQKLTTTLESGKVPEDRKLFLQDEVLFPLKQRIIDLQQQLAVNQQGVLTTETIVRNNRELIRGVDRSLNVTVTALQTAATLAVALQHQKQVLKGVKAVSDTTNELIVQTSEQLKTQGVEIQKQASSASLDIEKLKIAFENVDSALNDISTFRREALPHMAQSILEMESLTTKMEDSIVKMEKGTQVKQELSIEL
ncbi:toxic anion resistance protein [Arenicella sp. 4NH20-0111]|uniref:toxic anion resistance protein n=1 Tax=Arenicella sp. 4NH20-0111 TaxID=3127648 RepID=UPI003104EB80